MGDNNAVIVQILAVVLILFLCFVTYMNTKTWRATQVVFLFLVFGAALTFSVYSALILKTRKAWEKVVADLEKKVAVEEKIKEQLVYGKNDAPKEPGLMDLRAAAGVAIIDRGRVWRDCAFQGKQVRDAEPETGDAIVVVNLTTTPVANPAAANPAEKPEPNHLEANTVLYAFRDQNPNAPFAPQYIYMGEFSASAVTDSTVTLSSTVPLSKFEQELIQGNQPWILYEVMPGDSQAAFTYDGAKAGDFIKGDEFKEVVWEYDRDGMTIEQVVADRKQKGQSPLTPTQEQQRTFAKVKFLKEHKVVVDAAAPSTAISGNSEVFDRTGRALDPRLQRGSEVVFKPGDEAELLYYGFSDKDGTLVEKGAIDLEKEGIVNVEARIYRRDLHDYAYEFRHISARWNQVAESLRQVNREIATVAEEEKLAKANAKARQEEKLKLVEDQTRLLEEKKKITKYATDLDTAYRSVRADLSRLYRENTVLHDRIVAANEKLTRQIEARTATPTALER